MRAIFISLLSLTLLGCGLSSADLKVTDAVIATAKPNIIFNLNFEKDLTNKLSGIKENFATFLYKDKFYLTGGDTTSITLSDNEVYDINDFSFKLNAGFPTKKTAFGTGIIDNYLYLVGGFNGTTQVNDVEVFNIEKNIWEKKSPLQIKRNNVSVSAVDNKLYAIGGGLSDNTWSKEIEVYTPNDDNWQRVKEMPTERSLVTAVALKNKIYVMGGENSKGVLDTFEEYNIKTDTWKTKKSLLAPRSNARAVVIDDYIILIGGIDKDKKASKAVEIFNTTNNNWVKANDMDQTLEGFGAIYKEKDNKIYIFGGKRNGIISDKITAYTIDKK